MNNILDEKIKTEKLVNESVLNEKIKEEIKNSNKGRIKSRAR